MKKNISFILSLFFISFISNAQLSTSLNLFKPSSTLSEWFNNSTVSYIVNSTSDNPLRVIIKAELKLADGTLVANLDLSKATTFTITRGTRIFNAQDVLPLEIAMFTGSYKQSIEKTGKLPAGLYQLNVQLVEPGTFFGITPIQNKIFNLAAPQLPILMMPIDGAILEAKKAETAIIFRWTPVSGIPSNQLQFRIQVFEILPTQQPNQALRANQPILEQLINGQTQYIWRPQMSFSIDSIPRKFVWSIQTFEGPTGMPLLKEGSGESRSEPKTFSIKK